MTDGDGYVRVGALRAILATLPDDTLVVLAKDGEGNSYSPLADAAEGHQYQADTTWSGDLVDVDGEPCIVLWPTN